MPPPTNRASYLPSKQCPINTVSVAPYTPPSTGEVVIATKAIAINPADHKIQQLGIIVQEYPAILGCDVAGEIVEVDESVAERYQIGDRVMGSASPFWKNQDGVYCYSGFQEYVVLREPYIAKIPRKVEFRDAVVLPLGINTAASCLFMKQTLGLRVPETRDGSGSGEGGQEEKKNKKTLLVWGASSSVGACGVQLATHAGYEVVGVASKRNHEMVKRLGASGCFDQNDSTVVDDIVTYLHGKEVVGAYSAVGDDSALDACCEILDRCDGKKFLASVRPGAEEKATRGVKIGTNLAAAMAMIGDGTGKAIWHWLTESMERGSIKYMPQAEVVGTGLEEIQQAVDTLARGVSAKKLVVLI